MVVKSEKSKFESFASEAIRGPRKGIYEHLLCQHLVSAVSSRPLRKIRLMCEATMMLPDPKSVEVDMNEIDIIYKVARAFQQSSHYKIANVRYCFIPWPFEDTEENYNKYIAVWRQDIRLRYYPIICPYVPIHQEEEYKRERERIEKEVGEFPFWKQDLWMTRKGQLTERSFDSLVSQFTAWALPKIQQTFVKVAKQVNPTLYHEILQSIQSPKVVEEQPT